jgi:hypothetical protein
MYVVVDKAPYLKNDRKIVMHNENNSKNMIKSYMLSISKFMVNPINIRLTQTSE